MSNLTAATTGYGIKKIGASWTDSHRIANASRMYKGAFAGFPGANALTSSRGYLCKWQDQLNMQWAGIVESQSWTGGLLTSARTGTAANVDSVLGATGNTPIEEVTIERAPLILISTGNGGLSVTGVSAQTDVMRTLVYCSTDNFADMKTTATSYAPAIGKVNYWYSSTYCDVFLFGALRTMAIS